MAENRTLLVVNDEEVVCQACRRIFSRQGFQVETNTDARQGLSWATEKDYTIILLDIKMPNIDGIQFLEQLRPKKPDVPVLMITGYPSIPNAAAAMRLGACDYVTKPFTLEEITWAVQRVLATRRWPGEEEAAGGAARRGPGSGRFGRGGCGDAVLERIVVAIGGRRLGLGGGRAPGAAGDCAHEHPPATDRRSGLPGFAFSRRRRARQTDVDRPVADFRRGPGRQ